MKKLSGIICILLFVFVMISCKQSPQQAEKHYHDVLSLLEQVISKEEQLINEINKLIEIDTLMNDFSFSNDSLSSKDDFKQLDLAYNNLCMQIEVSYNRLKELPDFDKENALKQSAAQLLNTYQQLSQKEYPEIISIVKKPHKYYSSEDDQRFIELNGIVDSLLQEKIDRFIKETKIFAQNYKFELIEDVK